MIGKASKDQTRQKIHTRIRKKIAGTDGASAAERISLGKPRVCPDH